MNNYLIPANSKRSLLYFGIFKPFDLGLFLAGVGVTLILLMLVDVTSATLSFVALAPALIAGFLIIPVPNYYNMRTLIGSVYIYFTSRQRFIWKGWCLKYGKDTEE